MPIVKKGEKSSVILLDESTDVAQPIRIESSAEVAAVIVEVALPKDLYEVYQQVASAQGLSLEDVLLSRLRRCKSHNSLRGVYLSDAERQKIEGWLKSRPIESGQQLVAQLESIFTVRVEGFEPIPISAAAFKRLGLREGFGGMTAQGHVTKIVKDAIVRALGVN
jgi:hypothetical protein